MSQEKVDRYKKEKANREKIMRRERWITRLEVTDRNHNDERDGYSELFERDQHIQRQL